MKFLLTHPSYDNVNFALKSIIQQMDEEDFRPTLIVGLARGGLVPAVILSQSLNVPMQAIHYSSKSGKGEGMHDNVIPDIRGKKIVCLDDIADTGNSMKEVCDILKVHNDVRSAVIYSKDGSVITPDYHWHPLPKDAPFIYFPWERNIKYMNF